jgi:pimeloyl-ACP methyl ester carboxylesterase
MLLNFRKIGSGPPLVVLHGVFGSGDNWLTVSKAFADTHTVYLVDLRNHGHSPWSDAFNYDLMAEDVYELAQNESLNKFVLLGHSMGGKVAMRFAQLYPQLLEKLIIVDIAPRSYKPHHQNIIDGFRAVPLATLAGRQEADTAMAKHIAEADVRQFLLKNLYRTPEGNFTWRLNLDAISQNISEVGAELPASKEISTKTLFIAGANSKYIQAADEKDIHQRFSNVTIKSVPNAGHWVHAEQPVAFAATVNEFLNT